MTLNYRPVSEAGREVARHLYTQYMNEPPEPDFDADEAAAWFDRHFFNAALSGSRHVRLAYVDEQPIGFVIFTLNNYAFSPAKQYGKINEFYIVPEQRRSGYGRQLAGAAFSEMKRLGARELEADVLKENVEALAFWQSLDMGINHYVLTLDAGKVGDEQG